ncbi:MAG: hypothetical protein ACUVTL_00135 [Thermoproteota archaeon]
MTELGCRTLPTCACCKRQTEGESRFCNLHRIAYKNLLAAFKAWRSAIPSIQVKNFLERILQTNEVGSWAAEVARFLLSENSVEEIFYGEEKG